MGVLDWFRDGDQARRATRYEHPDLIAFYWDGGVPDGRCVKDVSLTGAYLCTHELWYPGTILIITFKQAKEELSYSLPCEVVRSGPDGMGVRFMTKGQNKVFERFIQSAVNGSSGDGL